MAGEQLRLYAAERAGATAIIETLSGDIVGWIVRDGEMLRGPRGSRTSEPA
ncbi:hypothetical protein [Demequina rhizosphaerae]|uniref:hypothetical protein n=1 Tax=Demequina rhizosphaerae TaxID=1638985 RepID=UPI0012DFFC8F|nr:hypothetical protein [Demequina rhizosphaerae]